VCLYVDAATYGHDDCRFPGWDQWQHRQHVVHDLPLVHVLQQLPDADEAVDPAQGVEGVEATGCTSLRGGWWPCTASVSLAEGQSSGTGGPANLRVFDRQGRREKW
jgi:hypothetical protein